jgi:leader peptidase (prepilin peptidase)/N-methyltransferase
VNLLFTWGWPGVVGVLWLGLCVGSFLNVVIHRLPIMLERRWRADATAVLADAAPMTAGTPSAPDDRRLSLPDSTIGISTEPKTDAPFNLMLPRSRCPHCGHTIRAHENIPVISWLALGGRCAACRAPISLRYPVVELLTAIASVAIIASFGFTAFGLAALVLTWMLIALTGIDFDTQLLPDQLTLPLLWLGLAVSVSVGPIDPATAILGAIAGYGVLWTVYWGFRLATGKEGMGYGDFKLLGALGAWLGWPVLPGVLLIAAVSGLAWALVGMLRGQHARGQTIAFGPFLALGGWIALLWRDTLVALILPGLATA